MKRAIAIGIFIVFCLWTIVKICVYTKENNRYDSLYMEACNDFNRDSTDYMRITKIREQFPDNNSIKHIKSIDSLIELAKANRKEVNRYDSLYMVAYNIFNQDSADYMTITKIREQFPDNPFLKHIKSIDSLIERAKTNNIPYQKELKKAKKTILLGFRMGMTRNEYNKVWRQNVQNGNIKPYDEQYKYIEFGNTSVTASDCGQSWTENNYYLFAELRYAPVFRNDKLHKWTIVLWPMYPDRSLPNTSNFRIIQNAINKQFPYTEYNASEDIWSDENIEISLQIRSVPSAYGNDRTYVIEYLNKD